MELNRTIQPEIKTDFKFELLKHDRFQFSNGCTLYNFPYDVLPVCKIDFFFPAGKKHQKRPLQAHYTGKMLFEGTSAKTQEQIAAEIDFMGASLNSVVNEDYTHITSLALNRQIPEILTLIHHLLTDSLFPEEQLRILTENDKQEFLVNNERVQYIARRNLFQTMFTESHPFGKHAVAYDYETISSSELRDFFDHYYDMSRCIIVWTGTMSSKHFHILEQLFGNLSLSPNNESATVEVNIPNINASRINEVKQGASQSAIMIGRIFPCITEPDHYPLNFVSTILGGYFGSRLMKNIREEKGYTYGIGSTIIPYQDLSVFMIGSQVKAEYTEEAVTEINREILRLQSEPVPEKELELVRNYLYGTLMQNLDGPFAQSKFHSLALKQGIVPEILLKNIIDSIKQTDKNTILQLSNTYFNIKQLFYSVAGQPNLEARCRN